jgi:hypothetical protein
MPSIHDDAAVYHAIQSLDKERVEANIGNLAAWTYLPARTVKQCLYSLSASNMVTLSDNGRKVLSFYQGGAEA